MARETHRRGRPSLVPPEALGARASAWHGDPARGAGLAAPTAPHATPPAKGASRPAGPARFWDPRRVRIALGIALALSFVVHGALSPWRILPPTTDIELKDVDGELAIPVDVLGGEPPAPPPPEPVAAPPVEPASKDPDAPGTKRDAGPPPLPDAGAPLAVDAGAKVPRHDAGVPDAGGPVDAGGLVALASDGGAGPGGATGPTSPEAMFGMTKAVNAGTQNVVLGLNVALIRKHPVGARLGPVLQAIPQWREFVQGARSPVDPIRDTDWILIYGPSLIHTDKDAVLVRYNVADEAVDATMQAVAAGYAKGGPFDVGIPNVPASRAFADNAERVFVRPQSKLLVIVPPSHAKEAAATYRRSMPRGPSPGEAMRLIVRRPSNQISIPGLRFSTKLTELRHWIVPRSDGGADVYVEGDCTDEAAAAETADALTELLRRQNSLGVKFATRGLLNKAVVVPEGSKIAMHLEVTPEQLEAVLQLVAAALNVSVAPASGAASPSRPVAPDTE